MATITAPRSERLIEYTAGVGGNLDKENHVIRGVKLLGLESKNGRRYLPTAVKQAIGLYEGAKVNVNHPKHPSEPRNYQDRIGSTRNVEFREGQGLFGDLHYNPAHPVAPQLEHDAEHAPANVGLSHNVEARTSRRDGKTVIESIVRVQSVDLVADPATTGGLYEHEGDTAMSLAEMTVEQILAARPELKASIVEEIQNGETAKQREAELKALKEELDTLRASQKLAERKAAVAAKLAEAKLPAELLSDVFLESCYEADDAKLAKLIEDRAALAKLTVVKKPVSHEQRATEAVSESSLPDVSDAKSFAAALCG